MYHLLLLDEIKNTYKPLWPVSHGLCITGLLSGLFTAQVFTFCFTSTASRMTEVSVHSGQWVKGIFLGYKGGWNMKFTTDAHILVLLKLECV
jgi:hypothetical protein